MATQFIIGNILDPKLLGENLGLHPVVILLSLLFWGYIWGVAGMFLAVPDVCDNQDSGQSIRNSTHFLKHLKKTFKYEVVGYSINTLKMFLNNIVPLTYSFPLPIVLSSFKCRLI